MPKRIGEVTSPGDAVAPALTIPMRAIAAKRERGSGGFPRGGPNALRWFRSPSFPRGWKKPRPSKRAALCVSLGRGKAGATAGCAPTRDVSYTLCDRWTSPIRVTAQHGRCGTESSGNCGNGQALQLAHSKVMFLALNNWWLRSSVLDAGSWIQAPSWAYLAGAHLGAGLSFWLSNQRLGRRRERVAVFSAPCGCAFKSVGEFSWRASRRSHPLCSALGSVSIKNGSGATGVWYRNLCRCARSRLRQCRRSDP